MRSVQTVSSCFGRVVVVFDFGVGDEDFVCLIGLIG
jgi:tRNA(Phe) wybutosine-synthesizing methylase Tyw3